LRLGVDSNILREDMARIADTKKTAHTNTVQEKKNVVRVEKVVLSRFDALVERFIMLLLLQKNTEGTIAFPLDSMSTGHYAALYEMIKTMYTTANTIDITALREKCAKESKENIIDILLIKGESIFVSYTNADYMRELAAVSARIKKEWIQSERSRLNTKIAQAEKDGNREHLDELMKELVGLK